MLQLSSLDAEAKDISARHGLAPPELSQPQPGDSDDDDDEDEEEDDAGDGGPDVTTALAGGSEGGEGGVSYEGHTSTVSWMVTGEGASMPPDVGGLAGRQGLTFRVLFLFCRAFVFFAIGPPCVP